MSLSSFSSIFAHQVVGQGSNSTFISLCIFFIPFKVQSTILFLSYITALIMDSVSTGRQVKTRPLNSIIAHQVAFSAIQY